MAFAIAALIFVLLTGIVVLFGYSRYVRPGSVYEKVSEFPRASAAAAAPRPSAAGFYVVSELVQQLGNKLPASLRNPSRYVRDLVSAGYRSENALKVFYGLKVCLTFLCLIGGILLQSRIPLRLPVQILYIAVAAFGGFRLPDFLLARRIKKRQQSLRRALPDALDLMVVCAEAGAAIDRALRIVAREMQPIHPALSDELNLMMLEINAGTRRSEALLNMAERTREPEMKKFVTVLVQADRFGTEISTALRTHADHLRVRRRQDAEEKAGKLSVKLVFPIFLFILPCMLLITVGPAAIEIWKNALPAISGK